MILCQGFTIVPNKTKTDYTLFHLGWDEINRKGLK